VHISAGARIGARCAFGRRVCALGSLLQRSIHQLEAATRLALPGAKFALAVSTKVAGGADALADAVVHAGGETVGTVAARAKRQAAAVSRKASAGAGQVKRQVKKAAAAPKAAARRAVRKAR